MQDAVRKAQDEKNQKRQEENKQILILLEEGKTQSEIANIIGVSKSAISTRIKKIDVTKVQDAVRKAQEKGNNRILMLLEEGKTKEEIANIIGVSCATISTRIKEIDVTKVQDAVRKAQEKENNRILMLMEEGKTQSEIAEIMGVSRLTISRRMQEIDSPKVQDAMGKGQEKKQEVRGKKRKTNKRKTKEESLLNEQEKILIKRLNERTITKAEIIYYREELEQRRTVSMDAINLMLHIYVKTMQTTKAIDFISMIIKKQKNENIEKLEELRDKVKYTQIVQTIRKLLKDGAPTNEIAEMLKINEIEVIKIKKQIEAKKGLEI